MPDNRESVEVWADWASLDGARRMGLLHSIPARGSHVFSFEYDDAWLAGDAARTLDPALRLFGGPQYPTEGRELWGVFADSSPDRWGRVLLQRREAFLAKEAARPARRLTTFDYLLGVFDGHRMGALRYRRSGGPFLDDNADFASPPWTSLAELEAASLRLEREGAEVDPDFAKWLRLLVAPGRSLGGARPKASVIDRNRHLWIAKFPSASDQHDIGGWESVVHELAGRAAITVPEVKRQQFGSRHHTFLAKRFDRDQAGRRIHFASAMTLLDRTDGAEGASYLDLARVVIQTGSRTNADLEQLWRRIVFNICVSNVDDHLRNHGFLLDDKGWMLAPAYDLNPVPYGQGLTLNISETDNALELKLASEVAKHFRVKSRRAQEIIDEVVAAVRGWRDLARRASIPRAEQDAMAPAFRLATT